MTVNTFHQKEIQATDPLDDYPYPTDKTLTQLFENCAEQRPDAIAIIYKNKRITYNELNKRSNQLAHYLRRTYEVRNDDLVAVQLDRSEDFIIAILGILKAGGAYVPVDPDNPQERIDYMYADSQCKAVIDQNELFHFQKIADQFSDQNPVPINRSSDLLYVIYTSGSTGKPKGCMLEHRSIINRLEWMWQHYRFTTADILLQKTAFTFDVSVPEIFIPLCWGAKMVLCEKEDVAVPGRLLSLISRHRVTSVHFVPSMLNAFINTISTHQTINDELSSLLRVFSSGEALSFETTRKWYELSTIPLHNLYGPTEAAVEVTHYATSKNDNRIPIGKPIWNTSIYIVDQNQELLPEDTEGEICIAGVGLARGYLNNDELTREKFVDNPFVPGALMYKTGDLGKWLADGNIAYTGRKDDQVKIRGYRIELAEIESAILSFPYIRSAVVVAKLYPDEEKRLLAYVTTVDEAFHATTLRADLQKKIPAYMVPSRFILLKELPQTSSGKIDKKALPSPERKRPETEVLYRAPKSDLEKKLSSIWSSLLEIDKIGIDDNFFEFGGNSLLALKSLTELHTRHHLTLPITKIYQHPTIAGISAYLEPVSRHHRSQQTNHSRSDSQDAIAIIGMAGRFPGAETIEELWEVLKDGRETTCFFRDEQLDATIREEAAKELNYVAARGIIKDAEMFDPSFFGINPKLAEVMDPQQRIFLEISYEVLEKYGHLPARYKGPIGVFAGSGYNTYFQNNVLRNPDLMNNLGSFQVNTVNEKDYISSRTAYHLDLKGPAVSVHSACSTSLLAVAQAVESLRKNQCEVAIAGGASITSPIYSGHIYQEGAMLSKDGHCRSFDENATGTVFSDGAGVVLLKSLARAEADGDTIFAIIKGVGLNNDGRSKGSFTAPSSEGQSDAIAMALEDAAIDPSTISYIEAHGTGTPLGDPIEIEGLNQAFGHQTKQHFCAIGSIKSNMGHLTAAAGVAGLIKTTLSLYHKQIPASINFNHANPDIPFKDSPFYVNTALSYWNTETIRRAGVSSFGVGGTNVHVVLEESGAELHENNDHGRRKNLITWSAKSKDSLDGFAIALKNHLHHLPGLNLADAAFTLQTTRTDFGHRRFLIAESTDKLQSALDEPGLASNTAILKSQPGETVFLFPGQGTQYLHMAAGIYAKEPLFRSYVDECAEIISKYLDKDIREVIYPAVTDQSAEDDIHCTKYTQPALFTISYALAKLWISWGIVPTVLCGHSVGEYVAAHLAGIFSLEDGLKLVVTRGQLVNSLPGGDMLSIRAAVEEIEKILPKTLSIAAINSPGLCVVAGTPEEISLFIAILEGQQILHKKLTTSHAFHSHMMDAVVDEFSKIVKSIELHTPVKPMVSTVTGKFLTDTEARSPVYWTEHLRKTVQFSAALQTILQLENPVFIEVGPGNSCTTLVYQHSNKNEVSAISGLPHTTHSTQLSDDSDYLLNTLGRIWLSGLNPDWKAFYLTQQRRRINLPGYAYNKKKYWVAPIPAVPQIIQPTQLKTEVTLMRKDTLVQEIKDMLENASGIEMEHVTNDLTFIEIGLDSLLLTQIAIALKQKFAVPVTFRQLNDGCDTIEALASYLDQHLPEEVKVSAPAPPSILPETLNPYQTPYPLAQSDTVLGLITQQLQLLSKQVELLSGGNVPNAMVLQQTPLKPIIQQPAKEQTVLSVNEQAEIKKPFGAIAKIEKKSMDMLPEQRNFLSVLIQKYNEKTAKSKKYAEDNRSAMADPRVVSGFKPATKELVYPVVVNRSQGCYLWDIDGNKYIDALNGFGSSMLGYQPQFIKEALIEQIEKGYEIGPQHELTAEVSKLICDFTGFDRVALCNTGSEAVLGTMRIARTVTGRSLIVAFSGSYHGIIDEVIVRGTKKLKTFPAAPGIMPQSVENMLILDYGTSESLQIIREKAHEIAAVLVEPVQSRRPEFLPIEFLQELRAITAASDTALIFDEVISGFRFHPAGIQGMYGIQADLGTYGKVAGGGISIGIIAGKSRFMDALDGGIWQFGDDSVPEAGVTYFAGTFVRHPLALATTKASLTYMKAEGPALQMNLNEKGNYLAAELNRICTKLNVPLIVVHFGSLWRVKFEKEYPFAELLFSLMRYKGIHILDGFPCFITTVHSADDLKQIIGVFEESLTELKAANFIPELEREPLNFKSAPIPGARLGKDKNGEPAWFIEDPDREGQYLQIK